MKLGENAMKWLGIVASYSDDPSKFELPETALRLPKNKKTMEYHQNAVQIIEKADLNEMSYDNLDSVPLWVVFLLPRKEALILLSAWLYHFKSQDEKLYNDVIYRFQNLLQNFMREELRLFRLVSPMRKVLGKHKSGKDFSYLDSLSDEQIEILMTLSSPHGVLLRIGEFMVDHPLKLGKSFYHMIGRFSVMLRQVLGDQTISPVISSYRKSIEKLHTLMHKREEEQKAVKPDLNEVPESLPEDKGVSMDAELIEFHTIKLQEYDGYVRITGITDDISRNFRIYDSIEEDKLREEIWKEQRYPLRSLVKDILLEKYSTKHKKYLLKWGVDIEILEPNWLT